MIYDIITIKIWWFYYTSNIISFLSFICNRRFYVNISLSRFNMWRCL